MKTPGRIAFSFTYFTYMTSIGTCRSRRFLDRLERPEELGPVLGPLLNLFTVRLLQELLGLVIMMLPKHGMEFA